MKINLHNHYDWCKIMKITFSQIILFLVFTGVSVANVSKGQDLLNRKVTFSIHNTSLNKALKQIEKEAKLKFVYRKSIVDSIKQVDIESNEEKLGEILKKLLLPNRIGFEIVGDQIVLTPVKAKDNTDLTPVVKQDVTIEQIVKSVSGVVTDETNLPLPGVSVKIKGTNIGTQTDTHGKFVINTTAEGGILVFSFVGFITQEIPLTGLSTYNVQLKASPNSLNEVVVVGYGVQKKATLTGAIATLAGKDVRDLPVANISSVLAARLPGVNVSQGSGKPGATSSIAIRAAGTFSNNNTSPLYVIDGVVRDQFAFDGLDPSELDNISVLKDAASSAVYGSRAANGVILVTTRRGRVGKTNFNYSTSLGTEEAVKIPKMQNAYNQAVFINDGLQRAGVAANDGRYYAQDELDYFKNNSYEWVDIALKKPFTMRHTLDVSGGTDKVKYYLGGSYYSATGTFDNLRFSKYTLRANVDAEVAKNLTASVSINMDTRNDRKPYWKYDSDADDLPDLYKALLFRPGLVPPYINGLPTGNNVEWHPLEIIDGNTGYNKKKWNEYNTTLSLEYKVPFVEGLKVKAQYNQFNRFTFIKQFSLPYKLYNFNTSGTNSHIIGDQVVSTKTRDDGEFLYESQLNLNTYQVNGFVTYNKKIGKHALDALFVYEQTETNTNQFDGQINYFLSSSADQFTAGGSSDPINSTVTGYGLEGSRISLVSRVNYTYDDKYIAELSVRRDGSSTFAPNRRWGNFPSFSAAWRISNEPFFKKQSLFNELKLRASVGLLGNDAVVTGQWRERYFKATGAYFGSLSTGLDPGSIPNPNITWEKSLSYNAGLDGALINNKINFTIDAFYRKTYDILGPRNKIYPSTFGGILSDENYGEVSSKGFEISLGYNGRAGTDIGYSIKGNLAYAVNKFLTIDEASNIRDYQRNKGFNSDRIFGYTATGILRTQADIDKLPAGYTILGKTPTLGMLNYKDIRGANSDTPDGKIDENDQGFIGKHSIPPINYGLTLGFSWKNLSFNALLQGTADYQTMMDFRFVNIRPTERTFDFWTDHWTPQNTNAKYPAPVPRDFGYDDFPASTFWLRKGAFLRLKNVNIAYNFQGKVLEKLGISGAKIFVNGTNLFLLQDNLKLRDPEANSFVSYPIVRNISGGINVTF